MPRGGPRKATIGTLLPNRSDMRVSPSNLPHSQAYGQGAQQAQSLAAQPAAGSPSTPTPQTGTPPPGIAPGGIPSLSDPTALPDEPVTAGLPLGPGEGPDALNVMQMQSPELDILRYLILQYPNRDLANLQQYLQDTLQF